MEGLGLSLDGSTPRAARFHPRRSRHFRAHAAGHALGAGTGMPLQVNTLVAAETASDIPAIYELLKPFGVTRWSLFFLISVGRGKVLQPLSPEEGEKLMAWIYRDLAHGAVHRGDHRSAVLPPGGAGTHARRGHDGRADQAQRRVSRFRHPRRPRHHVRFAHRRHLPGRVSAAGGGQCPQRSGSPTFTATRRCFNRCTIPANSRDAADSANISALCGGSRARAYEATGDPLASDPFCTYEPPAHRAPQLTSLSS